MTTYRGQELSLQELSTAFSYKLEEILTDPNKYVTQVFHGESVVFMIPDFLKFGSTRFTHLMLTPYGSYITETLRYRSQGWNET